MGYFFVFVFFWRGGGKMMIYNFYFAISGCHDSLHCVVFLQLLIIPLIPELGNSIVVCQLEIAA